ncbi:MAG TPA: hypothetical protein VHW93_06175, partial [Acidimicrobiales bacterium]|nr:hypothetical protein [Acidimicrobiales bacterium]
MSGTLTPRNDTVVVVALDNHASGADLISAVATKSNNEIKSILDQAFRQKAAAEAVIVVYLGESERRKAFADDGAASTESWAVERFGVSGPTARALVHVGEKASTL